MYENITEEQLLNRMLARVDDKFDKRVGSVLFDSIAPTALEHKNMYISLDEVLDEAFIPTMSLDKLKLKGDEMGIPYKYASKAIVKLQTNVEIRIGSQFTCNGLSFTTTQKLSDFVYYATCDTVGSDANSCIGDVIMTENHSGLTEAKIIEISIEGEDDEETETYRNRLLARSDVETFGGNKSDYKAKVGKLELGKEFHIVVQAIILNSKNEILIILNEKSIKADKLEDIVEDKRHQKDVQDIHGTDRF